VLRVSEGVWSGYIGDMAGVKVPLIAMKHAYVVSEKIDGIQNMPNVRDHDASVYLRLQGDALCIGGYEPNPVFWEQVIPSINVVALRQTQLVPEQVTVCGWVNHRGM